MEIHALVVCAVARRSYGRPDLWATNPAKQGHDHKAFRASRGYTPPGHHNNKEIKMLLFWIIVAFLSAELRAPPRALRPENHTPWMPAPCATKRHHAHIIGMCMRKGSRYLETIKVARSQAMGWGFPADRPMQRRRDDCVNNALF